MKDFVSKLLANKLVEAREILEEKLDELIEERLTEEKAKIALKMFDLEEGNIQKMGRTKLVRVRIRKGKVQRRSKVSGVPGYTIRGGKMIRMSPTTTAKTTGQWVCLNAQQGSMPESLHTP